MYTYALCHTTCFKLSLHLFIFLSWDFYQAYSSSAPIQWKDCGNADMPPSYKMSCFKQLQFIIMFLYIFSTNWEVIISQAPSLWQIGIHVLTSINNSFLSRSLHSLVFWHCSPSYELLVLRMFQNTSLLIIWFPFQII